MLAYRASAAAALRALVDALQSTRPLDDVLAELLSQVRAFLAADEAYVLLLQGDVMVVRAADGLPPGEVGRALDRHRGLEGAAATVRQTVVVIDAARHRLYADPFGRRAQPGAFVATPMLVRGRESGLLVAARHSPGEFTDASIWWLELLAGLAAVVVVQDEAVRFQEQRARQAELLLGLAEAGPDEPGRFLGQLAATIRQGLPADDITLLLHDPERGELLAAATLGDQ
ncbi:MAG TPA: GAF domain-containing protein, partial [Chloroflexota bacterium]